MVQTTMAHEAANKFLRRESAQLRKLSAEWQQRMPWVLEGIDGTRNWGAGVTSLMLLGSFRAVDGVVRVLDGDAGGWGLVDLACLYNAWALRILSRAYDVDDRPNKNPRIMMEVLARCWMHAEAIDAADVRNHIDTLVRKIDGGSDCVGGKGMNPLCGAVAALSLSLDGETLARRGWSAPGPYATAVAGTLRPSDYDGLADYHIKRTGGAGFPEFQMNPYSVVPFELHAIERRTGVRIQSEHPLLVGPLAAHRTVSELPTTEELDRVISASEKDLGASQLW